MRTNVKTFLRDNGLSSCKILFWVFALVSTTGASCHKEDLTDGITGTYEGTYTTLEYSYDYTVNFGRVDSTVTVHPKATAVLKRIGQNNLSLTITTATGSTTYNDIKVHPNNHLEYYKSSQNVTYYQIIGTAINGQLSLTRVQVLSSRLDSKWTLMATRK